MPDGSLPGETEGEWRKCFRIIIVSVESRGPVAPAQYGSVNVIPDEVCRDLAVVKIFARQAE